MQRDILAAAVAAVTMAFAAWPAAADTYGNQPGFTSDYAAQGIPLGGFRLFPTADLSADWDDNVFKTEAPIINSFYFIERPELRIASQWSRHELDFYGGTEAFEYTNTPSENIINYNVGGNGRLDIFQGIDLIADASYQVLHELRTDPDINEVPGFAKDPNLYNRTKADAAFEYHPYHFSFSLGGSYQVFDYGPTRLIGGGEFPNRDRNFSEYDVTANAGYEFSPGYAVFIKGNYDSRSFTEMVNRNGTDENSNGFEVDGGVDMLVTNLITGSAYVGYLDQTYQASTGNVAGLDFGAALNWTPDPLWTVNLAASHVINNSVVTGAVHSAIAEDDEDVKLKVDYAILAYLIAEGNLEYLNTRFAKELPSRTDNYLDAGIGLKYILNRYMAVRLGYNFEDRSSNLAGNNFTDNQVELALYLQD
jgi:hypothetical protein